MDGLEDILRSSNACCRKRFKVILDWTVDSFFKRDLTAYGKIKKKNLTKVDVKEEAPTLKDLLFPDM